MLVVENLSKVELVDGKKCRYSYKLIQSHFPTKATDGIVSVNSYGIEVERQDIINNNIVNIERESIVNISSYRHKVHNLLKLIYDNSVSPIHLIDVIGEYVDEYTSDYNSSEDNFIEELKRTSM
jgi:hypothetical protein